MILRSFRVFSKLRQSLPIFPDNLMALHAYTDPYSGPYSELDQFETSEISKNSPRGKILSKPPPAVTIDNNSPESAVTLALKSQALTRRENKKIPGALTEALKLKKAQSEMRWNSSEKNASQSFVKLRVLDVDRLDLNEVHGIFMHSLVRRLPAEKVVKLIGRLGQFRDKQSQASYEGLMTDSLGIFGKYLGPESAALFARCHATISVPFMLDYTRKFGRFSRQWLAGQIERGRNPRFFDFCRYPGGVRPVPPIIEKPAELWAWARLLPKCSAKKFLVQQLLFAKSHTNMLLPNSCIEENDEDDSSGALRIGDHRIAERLIQPIPQRTAILKKPTETDFGVNYSSADLQNIKVHSDDTSDALSIARNGIDESTDVEIVEEPPHWGASRRSFSFRGKLYRLNPGEGWTRVLRKLPDYSKERRSVALLKAKEKRVARGIQRRKQVKALKDRVMRM